MGLLCLKNYNLRVKLQNDKTRDREIIRIYYDTASCILSSVGLHCQTIGFQWTTSARKACSTQSSSVNSKSTGQTNNMDVTDVRFEIHPIRHVS